MAVTIRYTHGWSLLYQIMMWIASLALLCAIIAVAEPLLNALGPIGDSIQAAGVSIGIPEAVFSIIGVILCIAAFFAAMGGSIVLLMKTVLPRELPTYLYVRLSLLTPISWKEAKSVSFLFEGDLSGRWYPLRELRRVPREFRHDVLMEFVAQRSWSGVQFRRQRHVPPRPTPPPSHPRREDPWITERRKAYQMLDIPQTASADEIKAAYRQLMKKYHPDVYANSQPELKHFAEEKAKALNAAYAALEGVND